MSDQTIAVLAAVFNTLVSLCAIGLSVHTIRRSKRSMAKERWIEERIRELQARRP
jgi:hypothetical protein